MICESFEKLTPLERRNLIGEIVHLVQSDEKFFSDALKMIKSGYKKGVFNGVKINPSVVNNQPSSNYSPF